MPQDHRYLGPDEIKHDPFSLGLGDPNQTPRERSALITRATNRDTYQLAEQRRKHAHSGLSTQHLLIQRHREYQCLARTKSTIKELKTLLGGNRTQPRTLH